MTRTCESYTGDIQIAFNPDSDWDINYINGQPCMTDGFDTMVLLAVFGEPDTWQNSLTVKPEEKYNSRFPAVIAQANVSDKTIKDGKAAIDAALKFVTQKGYAQSISVSGGAFSVSALYWEIEIVKGGITSIYSINWAKGVVEVQKRMVA